MSLRLVAENDLGSILEDTLGFGWPITITDPAGTSANLVGFSNDIAQIIDPDTGQAVSGRLIGAVVRISSLTAASLALPVGIADAAGKPWQVSFNDVNGNPFSFSVITADPDRSLGIVAMQLEFYTA